MTNQQAQNNYRQARSTMTQNDASCNYCGHIWEPVCEREETVCPNCRRNPTREYGTAPLGDVPIWRIKEAEARAKKALEGKQVHGIVKSVAKNRKS